VKEAKMKLSDMRVLIVADDAETVALLTSEIVGKFDANLTVVNTLEEARAVAEPNQFDVLLAAQRLPDGSGLALLDQESGTFDAPMILLDDGLDAKRVLAAMRLGVVDVLPTPIDKGHLATAVRNAAIASRDRRHTVARSGRLRKMSSKLVRDRRELRQRVDLVCRDLVSAYRRLAKKVVGVQASDSSYDAEPDDGSYGPPI